MDFTRKTYKGSFDPFWRGEAKILPGGYAMQDDIPFGVVVRRGTPVEIDPDTLTCKIAKSAVILDGGDSTNLRIAKGLLFVVGDVITDGTSSTSSGGDEGGTTTTTTAKITAIDTTNTDYDVLSVDTAISGTIIYVDCTPNAVVGADFVNDGLGIPALDIAYEVVVLKKALASTTPIVDAWIDGINLKGNPSIKLIVQ